MKIKVKAMCACGEEVIEKDMQGIVSICDTSDEAIMRRYREGEVGEILEDATKKIVALFEEDRPAEPELDGKRIQQLIDDTERILKNDRCAKPELELLPVYQCSECHVFTINQEHECK